MKKLNDFLKEDRYLFLFIFVVLLIVFGPMITITPFWDDHEFIFSPDSPVSAGYKRAFELSWPVFFIFLVTLKKMFGGAYYLYHLVSLLLHSANVFLIYKLLLKHSRGLAIFVASVFALHTVNYFAVTWIIQIKTLLSFFFFMLSLHSLSKFNEKESFKEGLLASVFFALSLFSKSMLTTFPIALFFYALFYKKFTQKLSLLLSLFFIVSAISFWGTVFHYQLPYAHNILPAEQNINNDKREESAKKDPEFRKFLTLMNGISESRLTLATVPDHRNLFEKSVVVAGTIVHYARVSLFPHIPEFFPHKVFEEVNGTKEYLLALSLFIVIGTLIFFFWSNPLILFPALYFVVGIIPFANSSPIPLFVVSNYIEYWVYPFLVFFLIALYFILERIKNGLTKYYLLFFIPLFILFTTSTTLLKRNGPDILQGSHDPEISNDIMALEIIGASLYVEKRYQECYSLYETIASRTKNRYLNLRSILCEKHWKALNSQKTLGAQPAVQPQPDSLKEQKNHAPSQGRNLSDKQKTEKAQEKVKRSDAHELSKKARALIQKEDEKQEESKAKKSNQRKKKKGVRGHKDQI